METVKMVVDTLGATVLLPIFIFFYAVILRTPVGKAFRSAVTIGVAFVGINLVIGLMWGSLSNVSHAIIENTGIVRDVVDVGWPAAAAVAFSTTVGLAVIPVAILVNIVLLIPKVTKTLNVDLWNFWHFAFAGSIVTIVSGNLAMGLVAAAIYTALMLLLGDWTARGIQEFYHLPGISIPHGFTAPMVPIAIPVNWVLDRVPWVKDVDADPDGIEKKLGPTFGDPMIMGFFIGIALGLIAYWSEFAGNFWGTSAKILVLGVELAAVMVLLPRMVRILMEGLIPISESARDYMAERHSDREVWIGLDSAVLVGHPSAIATGLLLVPIAILLMVILPGNRVLLFADLAVLPFLCSQCAPLAKGNVVRMVIIGTILLIIGFYVSMALAPVLTRVAGETGMEMPENAVSITSIADGFVWTALVWQQAAAWAGWIGMAILAVLVGIGFWLFKRNEEKWEVLAGASPRQVEEEPVAVSGD
jgi:PTS system galactitol-specific IIC component